MVLVEPPKKVQAPPLRRRREVRGRFQMQNWRGAASQISPLMNCGKKSSPPVGRTAINERVFLNHHAKSWQVRILAAQAIEDPGPEGRKSLLDRAGVHLE